MKFLMNLAFASMVAASSSAALAEKYYNDDTIPVPAVDPVPLCTPNVSEVATVLAQASEELAVLKSKQVDINIDVTCENLAPGKSSYKFTFRNCGLCFPVESKILTITRDLSSTLVDGAPVYTKSLQ